MIQYIPIYIGIYIYILFYNITLIPYYTYIPFTLYINIIPDHIEIHFSVVSDSNWGFKILSTAIQLNRDSHLLRWSHGVPLMQGSICIFFVWLKIEIFDKVHTRPGRRQSPKQVGRMYQAQPSLQLSRVPASVRFYPDKLVWPSMTLALAGKEERINGTVVG